MCILFTTWGDENPEHTTVVKALLAFSTQFCKSILAFREPNNFPIAISLYGYICVWIHIPTHLYLMKNIKNWLPIYCSNFFPYRPYVPQLHRDLPTQLSSAPVSFPTTCLRLGRKSHQGVTEVSRSASTHDATPLLCSNGFALIWEVERGTTGHYLWQCISNTQHATAKAADFNPAQFPSLSTQNIHKLSPWMRKGLGS